MSKKEEKLLELLEQIRQLYPKLDRVMITDTEDPQSIIFTTEENLMNIVDENDLDAEYLDFITEEKEVYVDWEEDDDDDDDRGPIQ